MTDADSRAQVGDATRRLIDWATRAEFDTIPPEAASRAGRIAADDLAAGTMSWVISREKDDGVLFRWS